MFDQVHLRGRELVAIQSKTTYHPLFARAVSEEVRKYRGGRLEQPTSWSQTTFVITPPENAIYRGDNL